MSNTPRWLQRTTAVLLLAIVISIALIAAGTFDPRPVGEFAWRQPLQARAIPVESRQIFWLDETTPPGHYTLRLSAAHQSGEIDVGYGLVIGDDSRYLLIAVSPLGYVTLSLEPGEEGRTPSEKLMPWQTWPHVAGGDAANEIWLDVQREGVAVRINRELLWEGSFDAPGGKIGLFAESFAEAAVIDFRQIELYRE